MKKKCRLQKMFLFKPLLILILLLNINSASAQIVNVTGIGIDHNAALRNAYQQAIDQVVGIYIQNKVLVKNDILLFNTIRSESNGYISNYTIIDEYINNNNIYINANIDVNNSKINNNVLSTINPDITVIYTLYNNNLYNNADIINYLKELGFLNIKFSDSINYGLTLKITISDPTIYFMPEYQGWYTAYVPVQIDLYNNKSPITSISDVGKFQAISQDIAINAATSKAIHKLVTDQTFKSNISKYLNNPNQSYSIKIKNFNFNMLNEFNSLSGINNFRIVNISNNDALIIVNAQYSVTELTQILHGIYVNGLIIIER